MIPLINMNYQYGVHMTENIGEQIQSDYKDNIETIMELKENVKNIGMGVIDKAFSDTVSVVKADIEKKANLDLDPKLKFIQNEGQVSDQSSDNDKGMFDGSGNIDLNIEGKMINQRRQTPVGGELQDICKKISKREIFPLVKTEKNNEGIMSKNDLLCDKSTGKSYSIVEEEIKELKTKLTTNSQTENSKKEETVDHDIESPEKSSEEDDEMEDLNTNFRKKSKAELTSSNWNSTLEIIKNFPSPTKLSGSKNINTEDTPPINNSVQSTPSSTCKSLKLKKNSGESFTDSLHQVNLECEWEGDKPNEIDEKKQPKVGTMISDYEFPGSWDKDNMLFEQNQVPDQVNGLSAPRPDANINDVSRSAQLTNTFDVIKNGFESITSTVQIFMGNLQRRPYGVVTNSYYDVDTMLMNCVIDFQDKFLIIYYIFLFFLGIFILLYLESGCCSPCLLARTSLFLFQILGILDFCKPVLSVSLICMCLPCIVSQLTNYTFWRWIQGVQEEREFKVRDMNQKTGKFTESCFQYHRNCVICLENFEISDELYIQPCDDTHFFHRKCGRGWLTKQPLCPICRANLLVERNF